MSRDVIAPAEGVFLHELIACVIARDLRAQDRVIQVGTNMPYARAGALLAHFTRLPDARIGLGLSFGNFSDGHAPPPMNRFLFAPQSLMQGESWMHQARLIDEVSRPDVFFIGGLQVDRRGNVNLQGLPDGSGGWRMRGPGAAALPSMSTHCSGYYIVMPRHEPRTFVPRVDCISALGDRRRRAELGLPGGGVRLLCSPLGVFALDAEGDLSVVSLHPGVQPAEVQAATGFEIAIPRDVARTIPPTEDEITLLRQVIDPSGLLRQSPRFGAHPV